MIILASLSRFKEHEKLVQKLEAEYREAKNLLVTPVPVGPFRWWERL